jgi:hypothetical protein
MLIEGFSGWLEGESGFGGFNEVGGEESVCCIGYIIQHNPILHR